MPKQPKTSVLEDTTTPPPSAPAPAAVKASKPSYVLIENKRRQAMTLSIIGDSGQAEELKLPPLGLVGPVREDRLTDVTRRLAEQGFVRLRR